MKGFSILLDRLSMTGHEFVSAMKNTFDGRIFRKKSPPKNEMNLSTTCTGTSTLKIQKRIESKPKKSTSVLVCPVPNMAKYILLQKTGEWAQYKRRPQNLSPEYLHQLKKFKLRKRPLGQSRLRHISVSSEEIQ